jgi:hypothetical protein
MIAAFWLQVCTTMSDFHFLIFLYKYLKETRVCFRKLFNDLKVCLILQTVAETKESSRGDHITFKIIF